MCFHRAASAGAGATVAPDAPVLPHFPQVDNWCGTEPLSHFLYPSIPQALMNTSPGSRWRTIAGTCGSPSSGRKTSTAGSSARPREKTPAASAQVERGRTKAWGGWDANGRVTYLISLPEVDLLLTLVLESSSLAATTSGRRTGKVYYFVTCRRDRDTARLSLSGTFSPSRNNGGE